MRSRKRLSALKHFGERLKLFRETAGLTQEDYATLMQTGASYIGKVERGEVSIGLENIEKHADFFDVLYYQFVNPEFDPLKFDQLPTSTRRKIAQLEKAKQDATAKMLKEKAEQKEKGLPGRAAQLHTLINKGFFKKPKTARQAFAKLNPDIPESVFGNYTEELTKITGTLSKGKFARLLDKLEPKGKSTAVRFVVKAANQADYGNPSSSINIAAAKK